MKYIIIYNNSQNHNYASNRSDLLHWLKILKDEQLKKTTHFVYNLKQSKEQEKSNDLIEKMTIFVQYIYERLS